MGVLVCLEDSLVNGLVRFGWEVEWEDYCHLKEEWVKEVGLDVYICVLCFVFLPFVFGKCVGSQGGSGRLGRRLAWASYVCLEGELVIDLES